LLRMGGTGVSAGRSGIGWKMTNPAGKTIRKTGLAAAK